MHRTDRTRQAGFSLVELAIVLVIIGLIVGGVLKGQDLIQSARLNDIQSTMNELRTATGTFQSKYSAFPGDFGEANTYVGGDATNAPSGDATTGNGRIDTGTRIGGSCSDGDETCLFWQHLQVAGLINGTSLVNNSTYNEASGLTGSIGGVYTINHGSRETGNNGLLPGEGGSNTHWVLLGSGDSGANDGAVLSPVDLRSIDVKGDDGDPSNGDIRGVGDSCADSDDASAYAGSDTEDCAAMLGL